MQILSKQPTDHFMTHLAMWEGPIDGGPEPQWGDQVSDEEYAR